MNEWDAGAAKHLSHVLDVLRERKIDQLISKQVRAVWRRNVDNYDHQHGDTATSLGITCSENLRELVLAEHADRSSRWRQAGVMATAPDRSLQLTVAGVRLGLMKAPPAPERTPAWNGPAFRWEQMSDVRFTMAKHNTAAYAPHHSSQHERQLSLPEVGATPAANAMLDLLVVWSGQQQPTLTAGWVGLPSLGRPSWYALEPLWWDEADDDGLTRIDSDTGPSGDNYDGRPLPEVPVTLKQRRQQGSTETTNSTAP